MKSFSCPDCGASIQVQNLSAATIECPYCNSSVALPEELRPASPPPPRSRQRSLSASPVFIGCVILFILFAATAINFVIKQREVPSNNPSHAPLTERSRTPAPQANLMIPAVALTFSRTGTSRGSFQNAHGITLDGNDNIYVSDETLQIQKLDATGKLLTVWTAPALRNSGDTESGPVKLFTDGAGRVAAVIGGMVVRFDAISGQRLDTIGGSDYVEDAALAPDGGLTLISWKNKKGNLVYLDARGDELKRIPGFLSKRISNDNTILVDALRLALDGHGNTFVVYALGAYSGAEDYDPDPIAVYKFAPDGSYVGKFGTEGSGPDQLEMPTALAIDNQSRIYVGEVTGDVKVFDDDGNYLMTLKAPHTVKAMAFDKENNLYIAGSSKVSKLVLAK